MTTNLDVDLINNHLLAVSQLRRVLPETVLTQPALKSTQYQCKLSAKSDCSIKMCSEFETHVEHERDAD